MSDDMEKNPITLDEVKTIDAGNGVVIATPMTDEQVKRAVKSKDLPPCVGNPGVVCRVAMDPVRIKGFDDKLRCSKCNELHVELVYKESGESLPNQQPVFVTPRLKTKAEIERRKQVLRKYSMNRDIIADIPEAKGETESVDVNAMTPEQRRHYILKKYSKH